MLLNSLTFLLEGNVNDLDDRVAISSFSIPILNGFQVEVYAPSLLFWIQHLILAFILNIFIIFPVVYVMFHFVIEKNNRSCHQGNDEQNSRISVSTALIIFGGIFPFLIATPYLFITLLQLRSVYFKWFTSTIPAMAILRVIEAMYRYSPPEFEVSLNQYLLYYSLPAPPIIADKKFIVEDTKAKLMGLKDLFKWYIILTLLLSIHESLEYDAVETLVRDNEKDGTNPSEMRNLIDTFFFAILFQASLYLFTKAMGFATQLQLGCKTITGMNNPLLEATSPSDFWGHRWNLIVHGLLKRGVFKPVYYHSSSKATAVVATFLVSGIIHEWSIHVMAFGAAYNPTFGKITGFFLWNGILVLLEHLVGGWSIFGMIKRVFPKPLITFMLVLCVLPIGHWYCDEYRNIRYFFSMSIGFPVIKVKG